MDSEKKEKQGWAWPGLANKDHYFDSSRTSLCGKWIYFGQLSPTPAAIATDRCKACCKALEKKKA